MSNEVRPVKKEFLTLRYKQLETLAKEHYDINYCFVSDNEAVNDKHYIYYGITGFDDYQEYDFNMIDFINHADDFACGKETYSAHRLLDMLCMDGHIPAGDYLITVSW